MCTKDVAKCEVYSLVVCIKLFFSLVGKCAVELFGDNSCLTILDGKATGVIHLFDLRNSCNKDTRAKTRMYRDLVST